MTPIKPWSELTDPEILEIAKGEADALCQSSNWEDAPLDHQQVLADAIEDYNQLRDET